MRFLFASLLGLGLIGGMCGQPVPATSISGQPFSADLVVNRAPEPNARNVLTLQSTRVYRDSSGRTRVEPPVPTSPADTSLVIIFDPVAGVNYQLDAKNKIGRKFVIPGFKPGMVLPAPGVSAPVPFNFCKFPPCPVSTSESLGTEFIDGVAAEGKRITSTSASGSGAGQQKIVVESWYSPELKLILFQKKSGGPLGESTTRVENLNRAEPDPLLFRIPPDYTAVDGQWNTPAVSKIAGR